MENCRQSPLVDPQGAINRVKAPGMAQSRAGMS